MVLNRIPLNGAILVVSAIDGVTEQTQQQLRVASAAGVSGMVVFLNKCDLADDRELLDVVEQEIRDTLGTNGFSNDLPIVRGSAGVVLQRQALYDSTFWASKVHDLLNGMNPAVPNPTNLKELPFLMSIEEVFTITGRGTVAVGPVERGTHYGSLLVDIVGFGSTISAASSEVDTFGRPHANVCAGNDAGLMLRGVNRSEVTRGQVLAEPGSIGAHMRFCAELYLCTRLEGGSDRPQLTATSYVFRIRTADVNGSIEFVTPNSVLRGGDTVQVNVRLEEPVALEWGTRFSLRAASKAVAFGIVTEVLD